jgi:hypothetical protein
MIRLKNNKKYLYSFFMDFKSTKKPRKIKTHVTKYPRNPEKKNQEKEPRKNKPIKKT